MNEHQAQAAALARRISDHHRAHARCAAGELTVGRGGLVRRRCPVEAQLFRELAVAQAAGWPKVKVGENEAAPGFSPPGAVHAG